MNQTNRLYGMTAVACLLAVTAATPAPAQTFFQGQCTVSVLNQTANLQPDGTWDIPNVPSNLGPVRARISCIDNGVTLSGASEFFNISTNRMNAIPRVELGTGAATPESIALSLPVATLSGVGQVVQATVTATFPDSTTSDVTAATEGTIYASTNATVASVDADGRVSAMASGNVLITAVHEAILDTFALGVRLSGDADADGMPDDFELANGLDPNDPVDALEDLDGDGLGNRDEFDLGTDVGNSDTDGDGIADGEELVPGDDGAVSDPRLADTDGDGVNDGLEVRVGTDPSDAASVDYAAVLVGIEAAPAAFSLIKNTILPEEVSRRLTVTGELIDGSQVDLTARGVAYSSSDLFVASFGAQPGRVFAGNDGTAVITASLGGLGATASVGVSTFAPVALSVLPIPGFANGVAVRGELALVAAGTTGLQVVDVSDPAAPFIAGAVDTSGNANDVAADGFIAYVADGDRGLVIVDLGDPTAPAILGSVVVPGVATDVAVTDGMAYVAAGSAGLRVVDITDPAAPIEIGAVDTPGNARGVDVEDGYAVIADARSGIQIVDVSNPAAPMIVGSTATRQGGRSQAADVSLRGRLAFVADGSDRTLGGLRVVDFATPSTPVVVGRTDDRFGLSSVALDRNLALGADFFFVNAVPVFDVRTTVPAVRGNIDFSGAPSFRDDNGNGIAVQGGIAYLVGNRFSIQDNGTSSDSALHIGRYAIVGDDAGIAPTVSIISPVVGDAFTERTVITVTAQAEDDVLIDAVTFLVDGVPVASDFSTPYRTTIVLPGGVAAVTLGATATDLGGNQGTAEPLSVGVLPDNGPTVRIVSPVDGSRFTEGATIALAAVATDDVSVASVTLSVDGVAVASPMVEPFRTEFTIPVGATQLTVSATAIDGVSQSADADAVMIGVDANQPPSVALLEPADGEDVIEGSTVRLIAGALDDLAIDRVEFLIDGIEVAQDATAPYELNLAVPFTLGSLSVSAIAVDLLGLSAQADATLNVIPDPGTTVQGQVLLPDGAGPAADATVIVLGITGTTDFDGHFTLFDVPTAQGNLVVTASLETAEDELTGSSSPAFPVPEGITDVGTIELSSVRFEPDFGTGLLQSDDDTDFIAFAGGFTFPFYGVSQTGIFVNSNGNLTFGGGNTTFDPPVPGGIVNGLPRISPLFTDLNPATGGDVFVNQQPDRIILTWSDVPQFNEGGSNTFQVVLFASGNIQFGYNGLTADGFGDGAGPDTLDISVAISPGGSPPIRFVDYSAEAPFTSAPGEAVFELFNVDGSFDLDGGFVIFRPSGPTTYDVRFVPAPASTGLLTLQGVIVDDGGAPLGGCAVTVTSSQAAGFQATTVAEADGTFTFEEIPAGGMCTVEAWDTNGMLGRASLHAEEPDQTYQVTVVPITDPGDKPPN